jgi:hypothetical protein
MLSIGSSTDLGRSVRSRTIKRFVTGDVILVHQQFMHT